MKIKKRSTNNCVDCKRTFTKDVVQGAHLHNGFVRICPLCYAVVYLKIHGIHWEPVGRFAEELFNLAKKDFPQWEAAYKKIKRIDKKVGLILQFGIE